MKSEKVTIQIEIENGKTVFKKIRVELPLFEIVADPTETLGQYAGTINPKSEEKSEE